MHKKFINWFKNNIEGKYLDKYKFKYLSEKDGDFGDLEGVQIESEQIAGHIYFWSSGFYNFHLFDFRTEEDLIKDTHGQCTEQELYNILNQYSDLLCL